MAQTWPVIAGVGPVDVKARFTATEYIRLTIEVGRAVGRARDEFGAGVGVTTLAAGYSQLFARAVLDAGMQLWVYRTGADSADRLTPAQRQEWDVMCREARLVEDHAPLRQCHRAVVDAADAVISCWYEHEFAGETYQALVYAVRHGRPVVHIDPTVPRGEPATRLPSEDFWRRKLRIEPRPAAMLVG